MRYSLKDYLEENKYRTEEVARTDKPHPVLKDSRPISVYYESALLSHDNRSTFLLFDNGYFVSNAIVYPCEVKREDRHIIGKEMIENLLRVSDFTDLDREIEGKCACKEYEGKYKNCDECPEYGEENGCLGALYSIPEHRNGWDIEEKWSKVYGYESENHKRYVTEKMIDHMRDFMNYCGDRKDLIKEVLECGKNNRNNKYKKLFR